MPELVVRNDSLTDASRNISTVSGEPNDAGSTISRANDSASTPPPREHPGQGVREFGDWETSAAVLAIVAEELAASVAEDLAADSETSVPPRP